MMFILKYDSIYEVSKYCLSAVVMKRSFLSDNVIIQKSDLKNFSLILNQKTLLGEIEIANPISLTQYEELNDVSYGHTYMTHFPLIDGGAVNYFYDNNHFTNYVVVATKMCQFVKDYLLFEVNDNDLDFSNKSLMFPEKVRESCRLKMSSSS